MEATRKAVNIFTISQIGSMHVDQRKVDYCPRKYPQQHLLRRRCERRASGGFGQFDFNGFRGVKTGY